MQRYKEKLKYKTIIKVVNVVNELNSEEVKIVKLSNFTDDDIENGIVGGLIEPIVDPNKGTEDEKSIIGETFIKPKTTNRYYFNGSLLSEWIIKGKNLPLKIEKIDDYTLDIMWDSTYSG